MRLFLLFLCTGFFVYGQEISPRVYKASDFLYKNIAHKKFEDSNSKLILDTLQIKNKYAKYINILSADKRQNVYKSTNQVAVSLCSNGGFEEFENVGGNIFLKDYLYFLGKAINPIQCKPVSNDGIVQGIKQYDPNDNNLMVRVVPANIIDEYIGNVEGFDQYCLKINHENSFSNSAVVKTTRFKTDNETSFNFNFKCVLQSIDGSSHEDEQPFFKARVINKNGIVVNEFCLIADLKNCIYSQAKVLAGGSIVVYTKKWQEGKLDISMIPNNEDFTVEFISTRCGLGGHFGYTYIDDICIAQNSESLQGSIELDPQYKICPTLPITICGSFTLPNSGNVVATIKKLSIKLLDASNNIVFSSAAPASINLDTKKFCFNLLSADFPDIVAGAYNIRASISFEISATSCTGTVFNEITDPDANPGWDIWFLNCDPSCALAVSPATLYACDIGNNSQEFFNLEAANSQLFGTQTGVSVSFFETIIDATANTNAIATPNAFESFSRTIFARLKKADGCFKIIAIKLVVRNPKAYISGILNICDGNTILTASDGASYLWSTGELTKAISVASNGTYTVTVTDSNGCKALGKVEIIPTSSAPLPSVLVTQPNCFTDTGSIAVTSGGSEFSFDNGVTWQTTAIKSNLPYGSYFIKIKTVKGCLSYTATVKIVPFLTNYPFYTKVDPTTCGAFGSIIITTTASSYSFDDGLTWSTENTLNNLPSGTYKIRTKDAQGCVSNYNSVLLDGEFLDECNFEAQNPYCGTKGYIEISTPAVSYSIDGGNTWQTSNIFLNLDSDSYILKIKNNLGCTSTSKYVYLSNLEQTYPELKVIEAGCDKFATISIITKGDLYSFDNGLTFTTNPVISGQNGVQSYTIIVKKDSCTSYSTFYTLYSQFKTVPIPTSYQETLCDDLNDNKEIVDLTSYNQYLISNSANYTFKYYEDLNNATLNLSEISDSQTFVLTPSNKVIFARTISADGCYGISTITLNMIESPRIDLLDRYPLCEFGEIPIRANDGFDKYEWSTGELTQQIIINKVGSYWFKAYENHAGPLVCESTKNFEVFLSNPAKITEIKFSDWTVMDNTITVIVTGLGNYEYSIDGINFQDSNVFTGMYFGQYTIYVNDKNNCGSVSKDVFLMLYPNFFTPNGDLYNDFWKIKFSEKEKDLDTKIYDRHGKLIKNLLFNDPGWDGTLNGQPLPADDYWFVVKRKSGLEYKGHFALKR